MTPTLELKTAEIRTDDELIIQFRLPDQTDQSILHIEHFDDVLRVRGQAGPGPEGAFTKSIAIRRGSEPPQAWLQDGVLSIRLKDSPVIQRSTIPKTIS